MHILAELDTQRKALLEKGEEVLSHMVKPSFEELMAGRVQPSPNETPKEKEKCISAFQFMGMVTGRYRSVQRTVQGNSPEPKRELGE
jgi:hypothetical protein